SPWRGLPGPPDTTTSAATSQSVALLSCAWHAPSPTATPTRRTSSRRPWSRPSCPGTVSPTPAHGTATSGGPWSTPRSPSGDVGVSTSTPPTTSPRRRDPRAGGGRSHLAQRLGRRDSTCDRAPSRPSAHHGDPALLRRPHRGPDRRTHGGDHRHRQEHALPCHREAAQQRRPHHRTHHVLNLLSGDPPGPSSTPSTEPVPQIRF